MRTVGGSESAQPSPAITALTDFCQIQVEDSGGTLQDLTSDFFSVDYDETTDEIVNACTLTIRRREGVNSYAPLMAANPPLDIGREVVVKIDPGDGTIDKEVFRGTIDAVKWPQRFGDVVIECRDQGGVIADTWIETKRTYGSSDGVPLETVMQSIANDNLASIPTIYVPTATSAVVNPEYEQDQESVLSAMRTLAEAIGWVIRWRYIDSLSTWRWTLFEPSRSKTTPDHTFATTDYFDVTVMEQEITDIRNVVEVEYSDSDGARQTVKVSDSTSITAYGRRYMKISEASDSPVNNSTLATALANAALSDLKEPDALLEITAPYFWPGEVGVDLYRFTANDVHFSSDQDLAAMKFSHRIAVGEIPTTKILTRGKPSGGVLMWRRKQKQSAINEASSTEPESVYGFTKFARQQSQTQNVFNWTVGSKVGQVWVHEVEYAAASVPDDPYATFATDFSSATQLVVGTDAQTYTTTNPAFGSLKYLQFEARKSDLSFGPGSENVVQFELEPNTIDSPGLVDLAVIEAKLADAAVTRNKILDAAVNDLKLASAAVTEAKIATAAITETKIGAAAVTTAKLANLAVTEAILAAAAVTTTKIADNSVSTPKLIAGSVTAAKIAAGTITANEIAANTIVAGNIAVGTITATEIAGNTITGAKIAALTIVSGNIAASAIETGKLAANAVTVDKIAALTITADVISSNAITADKILAGAVTTAKLAAGAVTANEISSNAVTTDKLNAGAVTAAKISVTSLSAINADLGTVTAGQLNAAVVVASTSFTATNPVFTGDVHVGSQSAAGAHVAADVLSFTNSGGTDIAYFGVTNVTTDALVEAVSGDIYLNASGSIKSSGDMTLEPDGLVEFVDAGASAGALSGYIHVKVNGTERRIPYHAVS